MSDGFGRRGTAREGLRGIHFTPAPAGEDAALGPSQLRRVAFWIGAAALMIGVYIGTKHSGQGLDLLWKRKTVSAISESYVPINAKDVLLERANNTCRSRGDAAGRGDAVRQAAVYVACLGAESPKRLCQATHRTHFLVAVTNYYRLQAKNRDVKVGLAVVDALKAVIAGGYIPGRDIVAAGPGELGAALRGVEPRKSGC
jgi:hypothetical protein